MMDGLKVAMRTMVIIKQANKHCIVNYEALLSQQLFSLVQTNRLVYSIKRKSVAENR